MAELSILAGVDSSAYVAFGASGEPVALRMLDHAPYTNWYAADARFEQTFSRVNIAWCSEMAVLIPARLFDPTRPEVYLQQLTTLPPSMKVYSEAVAALDAYLLFALPEELPKLWQQLFPQSRFMHVLSLMLGPLQRHAAEVGGEVVHAYLQAKDIRLFVWRDGKLLFTNVFSCQSARDFLYFSLLAFDQTSCRPNLTPMYLFGEITEDAEIYRNLHRYVKELRFLSYPAGSLAPGPRLAAYPDHFFVAPHWLRTHL